MRLPTSPYLYLVSAAVASVGTDLRVNAGSLHVSLPEIFTIISILFWPTRASFAGPRAALYVVLTCVACAAGAVAASGGDQYTLTAARSALVPAVLMLSLCFSRTTPRELYFIVSALVLGGAINALIGLDQAFRGSPPAASLYTLHLASGAGLQEVMSWKLALAQTHALFPGQRSLAFGLFAFSNNLGEYLVYALVGLIVLWRGRVLMLPLVLPIAALFASSLLGTLARTAWLGAALVVLLLLLLSAKRQLTQVLIGTLSLALFGVASGTAGSFFQFDNGGTVAGRQALTNLALQAYTSSQFGGLLLGGNAARYFEAAPGNYPHSDLVYALLNFGIAGAALYVFSLLGSAVFLYRSHGSGPQGTQSRPFVLGALLAISWDFAYGFTWAPLANVNSQFAWMILLGCAFVAHRDSRRLAPSDAIPCPQSGSDENHSRRGQADLLRKD